MARADGLHDRPPPRLSLAGAKRLVRTKHSPAHNPPLTSNTFLHPRHLPPWRLDIASPSLRHLLCVSEVWLPLYPRYPSQPRLPCPCHYTLRPRRPIIASLLSTWHTHRNN